MALPFTLKEVADLLNLKSTSKRSSANGYYIKCPFCGANLLHLKFDNGQGGGVFRCVSCGKSGNAVALYAGIIGCDNREAYHQICEGLRLNNNTVQVRTERMKEKPLKVREETHVADERTLNAFYISYLSFLKLDSVHYNDLVKRGFTDNQITKFYFRSIPRFNDAESYDLAKRVISKVGKEPYGVPGFYKKDGNWIMFIPKDSGYYIPIRNADGLVCGMQMRFDHSKDNKYKTLSTNPNYDSFKDSGTKSIPIVHYSCPINKLDENWLKKLNYTVYLTEGPLKGQLASCLSNRAFIAIQGVNSTALLDDVLKNLKAHGFKRVVTCLDMDKLKNSQVQKALNKIINDIQSVGLECIDFNWDANYKGIDDYLLSRKNK